MKKTLVAGLIAVTAFTGVIALPETASAGGGCSHTKFRRVHNGMSISRVQHIMGSRGHLEYHSTYITDRSWGSFSSTYCDVTWWRDNRRENYKVDSKTWIG